MSATITIEEAQAKLKELIHELAPGEEVIITENQQPVAKLVNEQPTPTKPPRPRSWSVQGDDYLYGSKLRRPAGGYEEVHGVKLLLDTHNERSRHDQRRPLDRIFHEAEAGIALRRNSVSDLVANGNIANQ